MPRALLFSALTMLAFPLTTHATSVAYYDDDQLFAMADVVVLGVVWRRDIDRSGYPRTEYEIQSEECFKGCTSGAFVTMSLLGAPRGSDHVGDEWITGMPSPDLNTRVLVYLKRTARQTLVPISLGLSHYTLTYHTGLKRYMAHRDVDHVDIVKAPRPGREADEGEVIIAQDRSATDLVESLRQKAKKGGR
jgi:hypothetical protein